MNYSPNFIADTIRVKKARKALAGMLLFVVVLCGSLAGYHVQTAAAAPGIPFIVNYQAHLTDASGNAITATTFMRFTIFDAVSGGSCVWSATGTSGTNGCSTPNAGQIGVTPVAGVFSVALGDLTVFGQINALPADLFSDDTRYLEVQISNGASFETLTPRQRLTAAPYALNANLLNNLATSSIGGTGAYVPVTDGSGNLTLSNDLHVGTGPFNYLWLNTGIERVGEISGDSGLFTNSGNMRFDNTAGDFTWSEGGGSTTLMTLNSSGNLGIGTTTPFAALHIARDVSPVDASINSSQFIISGATDTNKQLRFSLDTTGNFADIQATEWGSGVLPILINPAGGAVGIGTATPTHTLDVNGDINVTGQFMVNGTPFSGGGQWTTTGSDIYYATGRVGIGTGSPVADLEVKNGSRPRFIMDRYNNGTSFRAAGLSEYSGDSDGVEKLAIGVSGDGGLNSESDPTLDDNTKMVIEANGNIGLGTTVPQGTLDVATPVQITGTVDITNGTNSVVGTGTAFTTQLSSGQIIIVGDEARAVDTISDDTDLTTTTNFNIDHTGAAVSIRKSRLVVLPSGGLIGGYSATGTLGATGLGSVSMGWTNNSTGINSTGIGSIAMGSADQASFSATSDGSVTLGYAVFAALHSSAQGSLAFGHSRFGGTIESQSQGSLAGGKSDGGTINADGEGAMAIGFSIYGSNMHAGSPGAFVHGSLHDSSTMEATAEGATAGGLALAGGTISAAGIGSFASGNVNGDSASSIRANAAGAFAAGNVGIAGGTVSATGVGSFAFGSDSVQSTANHAITFGQNAANSGDGSFLIGLASDTTNLNTLTAPNIFAVMNNNDTLIYADAATGRTGIGTSNPFALLSVGGASQFQIDGSGNITTAGGATFSTTGSTIDFASSVADNTFVWKIPTATGACGTGVAEGVRILDTGNVQRGHICIDSTNKLNYFAEAFNTTATDVAENYSTDPADNIVAGNLVAFDPSGNLAVKKAVADGATAIGVVSTAPGIRLTGTDEATGKSQTTNSKPIALSGRVPTLVTNENGAIAVGDAITASSIPGIGAKSVKPGHTIGYALDSYDSAMPGQISVFIQPGSTNDQANGITLGVNNVASNISPAASLGLTATGDLNMSGFSISNVMQLSGINGQWMIDGNGVLTQVAKSDNGDRKLYSSSAQNVTVTLYGNGKLENGNVRVDLTQEQKDVMAQTVPYNVVVTLTDSANGIYVTNKDNGGFNVHELGEGHSGATFDWTIIARRKGYEDVNNFGVAPSDATVTPPADTNSNTNTPAPTDNTNTNTPPADTNTNTPAPTDTNSNTNTPAPTDNTNTNTPPADTNTNTPA